MIKYFKIVTILSLTFLFQPLWAQFNYSKNVQKAHNAILDLNFVQYNSLRVNQTKDEKGIFLWLDGYKEFVNFYSTSKLCSPDSVINLIQSCLTSLEKSPENTPFYYYTITDLNLFLSFLHLEQEEHFQALQYYLNAKKSLSNCRENFPDFEYVNKQLLVQFVINNIINQQFGIKTISNLEAQNTYLKLMVKYLKSDNSVSQRELKLLGVLLFNMQYDSQIERLIKEMEITLEYAEKGPLEALISSMVYKKANLYSSQLIILKNAHRLGYQKKINLLTLGYGNALLNQLNDSSIYLLNEFIGNQQNLEFAQYAKYKTSMYWFLKGFISKSDTINASIKQSNAYISSEDKQALYEINHANFWTKELVEARLLFDGGEFKKALDVLLAARGKIATYSKEQKLEYSYRIARIYDKYKDIEKANKFYLMVINSKLDDRFYYPAYAAFYLGNLYTERGDFEKANEFYEICIQLDSPVYKAIIHKKAKQAMN